MDLAATSLTRVDCFEKRVVVEERLPGTAFE